MTTTITKSDVVVDFPAIRLSGTLEHRTAHQALSLLTDEGGERISTNLSGYGLIAELGNVFIKDWSEHEGLTQSLVDAGLVKIVREVHVGPFAARAFEVEVTIR